MREIDYKAWYYGREHPIHLQKKYGKWEIEPCMCDVWEWRKGGNEYDTVILMTEKRLWSGRLAVPYYKIECNDLNKGCRLLQYTGLKDKNGKKIYEGYIVKVHVFTQELCENYGVCEGEREFIAQIEINSYGILLANKEETGYLALYLGFEDPEEQIEVIGNIYENPELLEDK